jgi:hypothetical protein
MEDNMYKLDQPVLVMDKELGESTEQDEVRVEFRGRKGLKALKSLQDAIMGSFQKTASSGERKKEEKAELKVDDVLGMLEMTGSSEGIFDKLMDKMEHHATIGGEKFSQNIQDGMDADDLQALYEWVLRSFLLPRLTRQMNSLSK